MDAVLIDEIWKQANSRCEYCRIPQAFDELPFEVDHIIAISHGGRSVPGNLALSCFPCNRHKGPNLAGIDPLTHRHTKLFHPRRHRRAYHFRWNGPILVGRTTIRVLSVNDPLRVRLRAALIAEGCFDRTT